MIEIARFADVYEAEIAASRLRVEGYDVVLGGAEHVKTNPLVLQAIGGVNLSAPEDQADVARQLLERLRQGAERIEDVDPVVDRRTSGTRPHTFVVAAGLGILLIMLGSITSPHFNQYLEQAALARWYGYISW